MLLICLFFFFLKGFYPQHYLYFSGFLFSTISILYKKANTTFIYIIYDRNEHLLSLIRIRKKILKEQIVMCIGCKIVYGRRRVPDIVRTHFHWCISNTSPVSPSKQSELPKNFDDRRKSVSGPLEWNTKSNIH